MSTRGRILAAAAAALVAALSAPSGRAQWLGVRVQADLRLVRLEGKAEYDPRASAGVVFRFGDR